MGRKEGVGEKVGLKKKGRKKGINIQEKEKKLG